MPLRLALQETTEKRVRLARRKLNARSEGRRIAVDCRRGGQHEVLAAPPKDPIILIAGAPFALRRIGRARMDVVRKAVLEVHLGSELQRALGGGRADLDMYVHSPAGIPAGVYREKPRFAVCVRELVAA